MIFDELDDLDAARTKIKVIGVGGAGKNAIDHMIENEVQGVEFIAVNTDAQDLKASKAENRLLIGKTRTHGQGAGANPDVGRAAALESEDDIHEMIGDADMVFITCGMGGGTGTGAAPVIAKIARERKCLTVGICTKPFTFEGPARMNNAAQGLAELRKYVDTLIVIPNQKLLTMVDASTSVLDAFREADNVLRQGVQGISDIIRYTGLINVDFADVKTVMANKGTALMGIGVAEGPNRAVDAARHAIHSALLEVTINGATDAIVNICASESVSLREQDIALAEIRNNAGTDVNVIYGTAINNALGKEMVITVIATGYELKAKTNDFGDIAEAIYRNMEGAGIEFTTQEDEEEEIQTPDDAIDRVNEIFATTISKRDEKRRAKEEAKLKKLQEKEMAKAQSKDAESSTKLPSWLKKN